MTSGLSASGARIRGDDYQHLFAWIQVLRAIQVGSDIVEIGIEDPNAGNADDVTVYRDGGGREYYQVKSSVEAREAAGIEWLMNPSPAGGPSILQGFYRLWASEGDGRRPKLNLVTNRLALDGDPILSRRDGCDSTVARGVKLAAPKSETGVARKRLADHLQVSEEELLLFLNDLSFNLGKTNDDWMVFAKPHMFAAGLRDDEDAVTEGMRIVRGWVTGGQRKLTTATLQNTVEHLKRPDGLPAASLLIQAIDRDPMPEASTIVLDWANLFPGGEARVRRLPQDQALWNGKFRPELRTAAQDLRRLGQTNVLVRGYMRLPTWFAVGVELNRTAGFQVTSFQGLTPWSSVGTLSKIAIEQVGTTLGVGEDIAIGLALAFDLSPDVLAYLREQEMGVGNYVCLQPVSGASNQAIRSAAEARHWAYGVRDSIRRLVQENRPRRIHLFLAAPQGAILLLGHVWDRMPPTQLYEDLGPTEGYSPSYLIPN